MQAENALSKTAERGMLTSRQRGGCITNGRTEASGGKQAGVRWQCTVDWQGTGKQQGEASIEEGGWERGGHA